MSHIQAIMHISLIGLLLVLIIVVFSPSSFSSRLKEEVNLIRRTNEPSKVIKYKYPHQYNQRHPNRKMHPKHLDDLRVFKQQVLDAPSDPIDRPRRSQPHHAQVVSVDVTFPLDSNGSQLVRSERNRTRPHVLGQQDPSGLQAANDNLNAVLRQKCHKPKPQIVYFDQFTFGKNYWPR